MVGRSAAFPQILLSLNLLSKCIFVQVKAANKIVVIGGGAAGVELSGDIRDDYKTKDVTLIHPREILVNDKVNESFQKTIKDRLKYLGVKTILGIARPKYYMSITFKLPACGLNQ